MPLPDQKRCPSRPKKCFSQPFVDQKRYISQPHLDQYRCSSRPFANQKGVAVAVLRGPSRPFMDKRVLPLPFFVALSGQKGVAVAVAVLRGPSWPFAALRGQKVLPLQFFVVLSGPSWTKRSCSCSSSWPLAALRGQKGVAVAVLRGPSRPFVDKKKLPLPFFATLRDPSRTKRCCSCRSSRPFVDKTCCRACPQDTPIQPLATVDILYNLL